METNELRGAKRLTGIGELALFELPNQTICLVHVTAGGRATVLARCKPSKL